MGEPFVPDLAFIRERMPRRTNRDAFLGHALRHFEDVLEYAERLALTPETAQQSTPSPSFPVSPGEVSHG